ncbi:hypothetical protein LCGC14_0378040 [marine sediment metagenome]|uniref:Uncharacterized protein n=1 Tax=marine sediment metagenome TaxID=412755 RepID=A0A0F9VQE4_9ZZZZ
MAELNKPNKEEFERFVDYTFPSEITPKEKHYCELAYMWALKPPVIPQVSGWPWNKQD